VARVRPSPDVDEFGRASGAIRGRLVSIDYLGEDVDNDADTATATVDAYLELLECARQPAARPASKVRPLEVVR